MRRAYQQQQGPSTQGVVRVDKASPASSFRELDDAFLQTQTKIWLGEVLHLRFDQDVVVADLLANGELLFQVSKVLWKRLVRKNKEQLNQSKVYIYERTSFGKSNGKYTPYPKVDSFVKICQVLGLAGIDLFTPSDVVEKRNVRKVCMCIRSLSKKARMMNLNVPDFDIVTHTIAMPNYIVGGIRRSLEQPQCSSSGSSGYSPCDDTKALHPERISGEENHQQCDTHYDSDEAESSLLVLEPEDSIDDENISTLLELSNAAKEEREGYGDNGHDVKSLSESVRSVDNNETYCCTQSATDQCSRTITRCSISSQESDSIGSHLAIDGAVLNRIHDEHVKPQDYSIQGNGNKIADDPIKESDDLRKDTSAVDQHCNVLVCDRDSVCSGCEEPRLGINAAPSDLSLPAVSEEDSACQGLKAEVSARNQTDATQSEDEPVKSEDTEETKSTVQRNENDAPKSGRGVLKSVAGGITLVGAVFFIAHLRRNKGRSFTAVIPSLSEKSIQGESGPKNVDKGKASAVYPGEWLKV